ncbi:MAG: hypothetical protein DMF26_05555 [Verrucomicrobia bacterium]|nr:MAG: hypothetical protein DMF26_05555 [Verrucomicrobiota bacterium]
MKKQLNRGTKSAPVTAKWSKRWLRGGLLMMTAGTWVMAPISARAVCQDTCYDVHNTVQGDDALISNSGSYNTAFGSHALFTNTTGSNNTGTGVGALYGNTTGTSNTATGSASLNFNTTGNNNTATGVSALQLNSTGNNNTATGVDALVSNTTGRTNTAAGQNALGHNTSGNSNIALGNNAGAKLTTGDENIEIGNRGVAGEHETIRIGEQGTQDATFIAGISGATVTGTAVVVNSSGQLGVAPSSRRFKQNIQTMGDASDILLALRPVTFEYKPDVDPKGVSQFGLMAEEVEKVNPDLVARDDEGKPYTVRYDAVNAMLLNEFLKEHRKVEQLTKDFESKLAEQQKQIETLTA